VIILTAHADEGVEREAREAGASGFLPKGTGLKDLVVVLQEAAT
jgi:DNA-binding NarL/FixJ family response regulator